MIYTLPQIIDKKAQKCPNNIAFKCQDEVLTFGELWTQMNQIANLLHSTQVQKGHRVGIYMNRCLETACAMYGIMLAGAAYVPLDPESPPERTRFIIDDCDIKVVISNPTMKRRLAAVLDLKPDIKMVIGIREDIDVPCISWEKVYTQPIVFSEKVNVLSDDLAYILYTSGSTGDPKGIMHAHSSGLGYAALSVDFYGINEWDVIANHAPINFDISTFGYFAGPLAGATTVIIPDPHIKMPASLSALISNENISIWYSVPSALTWLIDQNAMYELDYGLLRWVLFAGEVFPTPKLRELMKIWDRPKFSNIFGPTEVNGCTYLVLDEPPQNDEPISIGQPWGNTEILIVDENDQEVQPGDDGELLVRSVTRMMGYWGQPERTAKTFYLRDLSSGQQAIYYRTGDLVRSQPDGNLTFLGRIDRQIKLRGYRIELDEIESAAMKLSELIEAAAYLVKNSSEEQYIELAVVSENALLEAQEVKNHCAIWLPSYAVPESVILVDELPRTTRGKVNYQFLMNSANETLHDHNISANILETEKNER